MEAITVDRILQADPRRVLLLGDTQSISPTSMADRNVFSGSASMSLIERQVLAGTPHVRLRTQYRMHPSISRVLNRVSYNDNLLNAPVTIQRPEIVKFKSFAKAMAASSNLPIDQVRRLDTCSLIFSPAPFPAQFPHYGSQTMTGSSSKHNLQTAMMVFRTFYWLVTLGQFRPQDILVSAFYTSQISLLRQLFQDEQIFDGINLGGPESLELLTVDSSMGQERLVQVVDCVSLGGGAVESMGFLGGDNGRFNVAMSRGKVGRIVICAREMKGQYSTGVWKGF